VGLAGQRAGVEVELGVDDRRRHGGGYLGLGQEDGASDVVEVERNDVGGLSRCGEADAGDHE
jgi:hypothetical protein